MQLHPSMKEFIENHINLIDTNSFEKLYGECDRLKRNTLSKILRDANIDWLQYVDAVPPWAFHNNEWFDGTLPNHIKLIGSHAFAGATGIYNLLLPQNLEYIDYNAFTRCKNLKSVFIPDSVRRIEFEAFMDCHQLQSVSIGPSTFQIEVDAFSNCESLKQIEYRGTAEECFDNIASSLSHAVSFPVVVKCSDGYVNVLEAN